MEEAHQAEMIFLAVPFTSHKELAEESEDWSGKIIVDVTNALHVPLSLCIS
jgi:predicted dinucleotide-binding enzyme